jgi:threonine dehydrogenase-like Zn-dependent dehydrogenase
MGAERIIAMSRHAPRQKLAREFGATDIVTERGEEGAARIKELTGGIGADSVLECVGTAQAIRQAPCTRPVPEATSASSASPTRWPSTGRSSSSPTSACAAAATVRRYLPDLIERVLTGRIDPGKVFDLTLPLDQVAEGYRAMGERRCTNFNVANIEVSVMGGGR